MNEPKTPATAAEIIDPIAIEAELASLSLAELREEFGRCYGGAVHLMTRAALIVKRMKELGDDLRGMPMAGTLLRIASGQLDAKAVWEFSESPNRRIVEQLPIAEQRKLAAKPVVPVVEPRAGGEHTTRMVDLRKAPPEVARLAIGPEGIRSPDEQLAYLGTQRIKATTNTAAEPDPIREVLEVSRSFRMTASEYEALRLHAAVERLSEADTIRRFLVRAGAFKPPKR